MADWTNGLVATTGKSHLGTMSTGLATTGIKELKVIIAESAISSWYDYYREKWSSVQSRWLSRRRFRCSDGIDLFSKFSSWRLSKK